MFLSNSKLVLSDDCLLVVSVAADRDIWPDPQTKDTIRFVFRFCLRVVNLCQSGQVTRSTNREHGPICVSFLSTGCQSPPIETIGPIHKPSTLSDLCFASVYEVSISADQDK